jgi:glycine cleavage system H protein
MTPTDLKYSKEHEWVRVEGDVAVIGITDYAQKNLGDIVFVEPPAVGKRVAQRGDLTVIESVKAASDVYAPVAGTVLEANAALDKAPELVNREPYGAGWIGRLKPFDPSGLAALMTAGEYERYVEGLS